MAKTPSLNASRRFVRYRDRGLGRRVPARLDRQPLEGFGSVIA